MTTRDPAEHLRYAFVRDGHLTSLPRRPVMLRAACAFLAERFAWGRDYSEAEVNALLAGDAPDHATLRRLLVDHGFLVRSAGRYRLTEAPPRSGRLTSGARTDGTFGALSGGPSDQDAARHSRQAAPVFAATRSFLPFDYLRVPYVVSTGLPGVPDGFEALAPSRTPDRRLYWPSTDGPALAAEGRRAAYRLEELPIFSAVLPSASLIARFAPPWQPAEPITCDGEAASAVWRHPDGSVALPFDPGEALGALWSERYLEILDRPGRANRKRLLDAYYRVRPLIPRPAQIAARRLYARRQRTPAFPRWPSETALFDLLDAVYGLAAEIAGDPPPWIAPWPDGREWALVLTHDVETADGYARIAPMRALEAELDYRSSWNFVPRRYHVDQRTVEELTADGCEVGIHGLFHDGRDLASSRMLEARLPAMHEYARRWGAVGFRSPATQRAWELMASLGFEYDTSYPDTDPYEPQPGGCCNWWPYQIGPVVELPITLPQDHTLFVILGHRDGSVWLDKSVRLRDAGGMALILTHPDYLRDAASRAPYRALLEAHAQDASAWRPLPREVAAWWRERAASTIVRENGEWMVEGPAAARARVRRGPPGAVTR